MITIKEISASETYPLRQEILRKGSSLSVNFSGDCDSTTFHLGVYENNTLIAISSYIKTSNTLFPEAQYQLRGMATLPSVRGRGMAKHMVTHAIKILKSNNIATLWCNARETAMGFYVKLGFTEVGAPFDIPSIGIHYCLQKTLN